MKTIRMQVLLNHDLHIDFSTNEVRRAGEIHRLEPRQMAVLRLLLDHEGAVVSREVLTESVWGDYGGGDEALTQAVSHLRKALGDDEKTLIRTVPKRGYRLEGQVKIVDNLVARSTAPRWVWVLVVVLILALAGYMAWRVWGEEDSRVAPPAPGGVEMPGG